MSQLFRLKNGTVLLSTEAPGGIYNSGQLKKIAELCSKELAIVKATEDQRLALFVKESEVENVAQQLRAMGLGFRHYQDSLHQPVSCLGELCEEHEQPAMATAMEITKEIAAIQLNAPLKIGVNGCARCCTPCHTLDISVVGDSSGYRISLGGKTKQMPEFASYFAEGVPPKELPKRLKAVIECYKNLAEDGETLHDVIERCGVADFVQALAPYSQDAAQREDPFAKGAEATELPDLVEEDEVVEEAADLSVADENIEASDGLDEIPIEAENEGSLEDDLDLTGDGPDELDIDKNIPEDDIDLDVEVSAAGETLDDSDLQDVALEDDLGDVETVSLDDDGSVSVGAELEEPLSMEDDLGDESVSLGADIEESALVEDVVDLEEPLSMEDDLGDESVALGTDIEESVLGEDVADLEESAVGELEEPLSMEDDLGDESLELGADLEESALGEDSVADLEEPLSMEDDLGEEPVTMEDDLGADVSLDSDLEESLVGEDSVADLEEPLSMEDDLGEEPVTMEDDLGADVSLDSDLEESTVGEDSVADLEESAVGEDLEEPLSMEDDLGEESITMEDDLGADVSLDSDLEESVSMEDDSVELEEPLSMEDDLGDDSISLEAAAPVDEDLEGIPELDEDLAPEELAAPVPAAKKPAAPATSEDFDDEEMHNDVPDLSDEEESQFEQKLHASIDEESRLIAKADKDPNVGDRAAALSLLENEESSLDASDDLELSDDLEVIDEELEVIDEELEPINEPMEEFPEPGPRDLAQIKGRQLGQKLQGSTTRQQFKVSAISFQDEHLRLTFDSGAYVDFDLSALGHGEERSFRLGAQSVSVTSTSEGYILEVDGMRLFHPKSSLPAAS